MREGKDQFRGIGRIRTAEELQARCRVNELTDCWHYLGAKVNGGYPRIYMRDPLHGDMRILSGPRAAAIFAGRPPPPGGRAWMKCLHRDCVNPAHACSGTVAQWGQFAASKGIMSSVKKSIQMRKSAIKRHPGRYELAAEVRSSEGTGVEIAQRLGLATSVVSRIRRGQHWMPVDDPFLGLKR